MELRLWCKKCGNNLEKMSELDSLTVVREKQGSPIYGFDLSGYDCKCETGVEYEWVIEIVID